MYEGGEVVDCCKIMGLNVMEVKRELSITLPQTFTRDNPIQEFRLLNLR